MDIRLGLNKAMFTALNTSGIWPSSSPEYIGSNEEANESLCLDTIAVTALEIDQSAKISVASATAPSELAHIQSCLWSFLKFSEWTSSATEKNEHPPVQFWLVRLCVSIVGRAKPILSPDGSFRTEKLSSSEESLAIGTTDNHHRYTDPFIAQKMIGKFLDRREERTASHLFSWFPDCWLTTHN